MRESIGGAWLFGIVIVFITLFASFLTYSISYTKAFNTKNKIIDIIEQNEGYTLYRGDLGSPASRDEMLSTAEGKIYDYMQAIGYNYSANIRCDSVHEITAQGYCIAKICPNNGKEDFQISNVHYKVTTYIALEIPILGVSFNIPITGETRTITSDANGIQCTSY